MFTVTRPSGKRSLRTTEASGKRQFPEARQRPRWRGTKAIYDMNDNSPPGQVFNQERKNAFMRQVDRRHLQHLAGDPLTLLPVHGSGKKLFPSDRGSGPHKLTGHSRTPLSPTQARA